MTTNYFVITILSLSENPMAAQTASPFVLAINVKFTQLLLLDPLHRTPREHSDPIHERG